jgi:hypothetical protein
MGSSSLPAGSMQLTTRSSLLRSSSSQLISHSGALADRARQVLAFTEDAMWVHANYQLAIKTVLMRMAGVGRSAVVAGASQLSCPAIVGQVVSQLRSRVNGASIGVAASAGASFSSAARGTVAAGSTANASIQGATPSLLDTVCRLDACSTGQ